MTSIALPSFTRASLAQRTLSEGHGLVPSETPRRR